MKIWSCQIKGEASMVALTETNSVGLPSASVRRVSPVAASRTKIAPLASPATTTPSTTVGELHV